MIMRWNPKIVNNIEYPEYALGRNGYTKVHGLKLISVTQSQAHSIVRIYPINSKNITSRCFIEIPQNQIEKFIDLLKECL